jgi:hypothetical protein
MRRSVSFRTLRKASTKSCARLAESENNDGLGASSAAAADAVFVTVVSGSQENVVVAGRFQKNSLP